MAYFHNPTIVKDGLVLYLDAANTKSYPGSGTSWKDLSGNGNNGTLINGPTFSSANAGSLVFDGVDDRFDTLRNDITNNSSFTLSLWFRITTLNSTFRPLIDSGNLGVGTSGYCLAINNLNQIYIAVNAGFTTISNSIIINTWYNIVGTSQLGTPYIMNVYINGLLGNIASSNTTNTLTNNTSIVRLGQNINGGIVRFPGSIAQTSIYNRALSATEILQNYNATKGRFGL